MAIEKHKYVAPRANIYIRAWGSSDKFRDIGNAPEATLVLNVETVDLASAMNEAGTLASMTSVLEGTFRATINSVNASNTALSLNGEVVDVAAVTTFTADIPALEPGEAFKLEHSQIESLTIAGAEEGKNYILRKTSGMIVAITSVDADPAATGATRAHKAVGILPKAKSGLYELVIASEETGRSIEVYKWQPTPTSEMSLISPTEFTTMQLEGKMLIDDSRPIDGKMGQLGKFTIA